MKETKHTTMSIEKLRLLIDYDPLTGIITRKKNGKRALFTIRPNGYLWGTLSMKKIFAHRAAWALTYGEWPIEIDHINRIKTDNRINNLRVVSRSVQGLNRNNSIKKRSNFRGVTYLPAKNRWTARLGRKYIGCFKTAEEAAFAFDAEAIRANVPCDLLNFKGKE